MSKTQGKGNKWSGRPNAATARSQKRTGAERIADEAEALRRELLAEAGELGEASGSLGALLDRAYLADSYFEEHVLQDPARLQSPALFREAWLVAQVLANFYQRVGQEIGKQPVTGVLRRWNAGGRHAHRTLSSHVPGR